MIHFLYLVGFALFVSVAFGIFSSGDTKQRVLSGVKTFLQFVLISVGLAWAFYFIPW
jgi:Na+/H+-dicarboxylate symporter